MQRVLEPEVMDGRREAAAYDAMDHSQPNEAFVRRLVELGASGWMLDIGTGPGQIPLLACQRVAGCSVLGVDRSEPMLQIALAHRDAEPFADRICYLQSDAKLLPFADQVFDAVFSNTILHHLADPTPMLRESWRVLRTGGTWLIRDLVRPPTRRQLDMLVHRHAGQCTRQQQAMFADSLAAALTFQELRDMVGQLVPDSKVQVVIDTDRHASIQKPGR